MTQQEQTWVRCAKMVGIKMDEPFNPHRIKTFRKKIAKTVTWTQKWVKQTLREAQSRGELKKMPK